MGGGERFGRKSLIDGYGIPSRFSTDENLLTSVNGEIDI